MNEEKESGVTGVDVDEVVLDFVRKILEQQQ